jgi:hypothetical protein
LLVEAVLLVPQAASGGTAAASTLARRTARRDITGLEITIHSSRNTKNNRTRQVVASRLLMESKQIVSG